MSDATTDDRRHVTDLVRDAKVAMLTTMTAEGTHVSRPMGLQEAEFDGDLWFLVSKSATLVLDAQADERVGVSLSSNDSWVSLSGTAELVDDPAKVRELWSPTVEAWFTNGPDDPEVGLLKFTAESAEYWDSPGGKIASLFSFVKSKITGEPYEGENETVELPQR